MWTRIAAVWLVIIGVGLWTLTAGADSAHEPGACPSQSWSQKTGPEQIWYKVVTACNDHPAEELNFRAWLQYYDWEDARWRDWWGLAGGGRLDTDFYAFSRYRDVLAYKGAACYRIRTHHYVLEWGKGSYSDGMSYSLSQCY
jgi:hypothetical protein